MGKIQIVIEISEEMYQTVKDETYCGSLYEELKNGTPLPKNHGRLIDADALNFNANYNEPLIHKQDIDFAPTIIEEVKADDT